MGHHRNRGEMEESRERLLPCDISPSQEALAGFEDCGMEAITLKVPGGAGRLARGSSCRSGTQDNSCEETLGVWGKARA